MRTGQNGFVGMSTAELEREWYASMNTVVSAQGRYSQPELSGVLPAAPVQDAMNSGVCDSS